MNTKIVFGLVAASLLIAVPARAQAAAPADSMRGVLRALGVPLGSEQSMSAVAALASLEVSTAPLGTSTGGFTFTFDPLLRTFRRSASSFGPAFAERGLTTGRGKISAGLNWLHATYRSFDGQNLRNGEFRLSQSISGFAPLPTASYSALTMRMSSDTLVVYGHAGVTDSLDVGVAVPWVSVKLDAEAGFFNASGTALAASALPVNQAAGIGDVAIFGKYRIVRHNDGGVAAAIEARLPTGDKDALRGLNVTRTLVSGIWSQGGTVSPHVNVGYEFWSAGVPISATGDVSAKNEFKYAFGVEIQAHPRATVVVDVIGRNLMHGGRVVYQSFSGPSGSSIDALVASPHGVQQVLFAPGIKWNVWESVLVTANVLAALSNNGLRADAIPVIGIDWAF
jgi:Putative MetA-pathway of phenol degradation